MIIVVVMVVVVIIAIMVIMVIMVVMVIRTDKSERTDRTELTFKLDFPGNLCRAALQFLRCFLSLYLKITWKKFGKKVFSHGGLHLKKMALAQGKMR